AKEKWLTRFSFPTAIGVIDCTHIRLDGKPAQFGDGFVNRKDVASINVQVTCDENSAITSIDASWPGSVHDALNELKFAPKDWHNYLRMNEETYLKLLSMVTPLIKKQDTVMRKAISPHERLTATLRFLATGRSYEDLKFTTIVSPQALGVIIPETCEAIYKVLRKDYFKNSYRKMHSKIRSPVIASKSLSGRKRSTADSNSRSMSTTLAEGGL
ncbi:unnamed protein product, partial [Acanthoscelides obtectus]